MLLVCRYTIPLKAQLSVPLPVARSFPPGTPTSGLICILVVSPTPIRQASSKYTQTEKYCDAKYCSYIALALAKFEEMALVLPASSDATTAASCTHVKNDGHHKNSDRSQPAPSGQGNWTV